MKSILITTTILAVATSANAAGVLTGGETWSALELFDFESDSNNTHMSGMQNDGSNGSVWNLGSAGGKFYANGSGQAITDGDAGTWTRKLPDAGSTGAHATNDAYATPYTSGKFKLEITLDSWDFTNHALTGSQDEFDLKLRNGNTDVVTLRLRIKDSNADNIADQVQGHHRVTNNPDKFSGNLNVDSSLDANPITSMSIEFDFDNDLISYMRNGTEIAATGLAGNDLGAFTDTSFDSVWLVTSGDWGTSTTSLTTESISLYTAVAVPEPSSVALLGLGGLALILRRRK